MTNPEIPDYAKNEGGETNWLKAGEQVERTRFYKAQYEKEKVKLDASQKLAALFENVETKVNIAPQKIPSGDTLSKFILRSFKSEGLMWQGLKNLQEQGYQVDWFPAGYTVEVTNNHLSIYKQNAEGKTYFVSPETNVPVQNLKLFDVAPVKVVQAEEPELPDAPEPPVRPVENPLPAPERPVEAPPFGVDETLSLIDQWNLWKAEIIETVVAEGMSVDFKNEDPARIKFSVHQGKRKERISIQRYLTAKDGGYTDKDAQISYKDHELEDPLTAVKVVIGDLKLPKEKLKITMPWEEHEHEDDEDSHDGHAH